MTRRQIKTRIKRVKPQLTEGEKKIRKIGGALESDFRQFRQLVQTINAYYFPLFYLVGFRSPEYTDKMVEVLLSNYILKRTKEAYIDRKTEEIESGKIKLEKLLTKRWFEMEFSSPEEKDKTFKREIHRALSTRYNKLEDYFIKEYHFVPTGFFKLPLKIFGKALSLTSEGFKINEEEFTNMYWDYMEAHESQTGKLHQEAANAINRFFGGKVEITNKELDRYFIIEDGIVKTNPKSINKEGYLRLGYRGKTKKK
jgi:hypothetical protein